MAKPVLSFLDYLREAFEARSAIPGLGALPINKLAVVGSFFLGFANPGFWFVGAGLETMYLYALSTNPRFQKYVQGKYVTVVQQNQSDKINAMILSLDKPATDRLNMLNLNLTEVNKLLDMNSTNSIDFIKENKQRTLSQLPILFLKLLVTKTLATQSLKRTDGELIKIQIADLKKKLEDGNISEALGRSIQGTLEILERRLENLKRAREQLQVVEMELNRIENQVQLVREDIAYNCSPESVSSSIDRINSTLTETEQWMDSHKDFFPRMNAESPAAAEQETAPPPPVSTPERQ